MPFHAPMSTAAALSAQLDKGKSVNRSPGAQGVLMISDEDASQQQEDHLPDTIYRRSLPSLHFLRWRPMYHLVAPAAWMNDPCAPGYDPSTGLYRLSFQWNPRRNKYGKIAWGNIAWGHATSRDLIHWTVSGNPILGAGAWYDREGCFTGCMRSTALNGSTGGLTIFYTGVNQLPLHYTLPYSRGCETLNIAESRDGGATWMKMKGNPIQPEPPVGVSVSGWRDPFIGSWPSIDMILGRPEGEENLYGIISGGLKDRTPTVFLYAINQENLAQWIYICPLIDLGLNHMISRWSGDMGINWECGNFMTLTSPRDNVKREFIVVGGEGSKTANGYSTFTEYPQQITSFPREARSPQWMCGSLYTVKDTSGRTIPKMDYTIGGKFDHGCLYGVNSFQDPITSKLIAWGWVTEEDLPQQLVDRQNWSGLISIPRELSLQSLHNVKGALVSELRSITSIETESTSATLCTVRTLGISPAKHVEALRESSRQLSIDQSTLLGSDSACGLDIQTNRFELSATLSLSDTCQRIGLSIFHSHDLDPAYSTTISLTPSSETLTLDRPDSSQVDPNINTAPETAPFTLFTFATAYGDVREQFDLRVFFDESVLEVFANDRCTFATRIYPATKRCWGVRFWAVDPREESRLLQATAWDGLRADIKIV